MLFIFGSPVFAKSQAKGLADMTMPFSLSNMPDIIHFQTDEDISFEGNTVIPQYSLVFAEVINAQRELRWHKSGVILCKINSYIPISEEEEIDISGKNIYIAVKKYEKVYAKEATILGTEIVLSQGASFFAPGVDVLYFFTKGAITRNTHPNWFMAGVSNAYENSICWFWLKGKPIELAVDDEIQIKEISEKKVAKLSKKFDKRYLKELKKQQKRELKQQKREQKKQKQREKELEKQRLLQP